MLLLVMAAFHGSGYAFVKGAMSDSNAPDFLKQIVPVLFVHPSFHLASFAIFGIVGLALERGARLLWNTLAAVILVDAILGFILGGVIPGLLLTSAALLFVVAAFKVGTISVHNT